MKAEEFKTLAENNKYEKIIKKAQKLDKKEKNAALVVAAIEALATIKRDECFNYIVEHIRDTNKEIRIAAIKGLADIGYDRGKTHIMHMIQSETDPDILAALKDAERKLTK